MAVGAPEALLEGSAGGQSMCPSVPAFSCNFVCQGTVAALLQAPGLSAEALLLKYARKSQTDPSASMFYTAR